MRDRIQTLKTPFRMNGDMPFSSYPRMQLQRDSYLCLNGKWRLSVKTKTAVRYVGDITVPFPPESDASGIGRSLAKHEAWRYERSFSLPSGFQKDRVILHIGAADQQATVSVNGKHIAEHIGGYLPFSVDITDCLTEGENALCVEVSDPLDTDLPYGKQRKKRGGMWYTPISGIWQTVWIESVPTAYIEALQITPTLESVTIRSVGGDAEKRLTVHTETGDIVTCYCGDSVTVTIDSPKLWTPDHPYLYRFTLECGDDTVTSYFALRTVSVDRVGGYLRLLLNGKPYFFNGLLDQGYFSDGIYLPSSEEGYRFDIQTAKSLGFNTLRKHIKIEPEVFYYECDRLGMIVFQDIVNSGKYHFLLDTALPTIGLRKGISHRPSKTRRRIFEESAKQTVELLYNHPCVCYYTLFNEGWGQYDADRLYNEMKGLDGTRIWDATSGWFTEHESDVQSEHIYFKPVALKNGDKPLVLSEFGGYSCKIPGHSFHLDKSYGYRFFEDAASFCEALRRLYRDEIVPAVARGLCGAILTQLSDVEDETNGLVTYDRRVCKIAEDALGDVFADLRAAFDKSLGY